LAEDLRAADTSPVVRERDLYRKLLALDDKDAIEPFLEESLALVVEVVGAQSGYFELRDEAKEAETPCFWIARGCSDDDVATIRASFSRGVIAEAIATGQTIVAASALDDPRFKDRGSVQQNRIKAVLCAPVGVDPPLGVLYLQDRAESGPFTEDDRLLVERCARHLSTLADRLLLRRRNRDTTDPTRDLRRAIRAEDLVGRSPALAGVLQQVAMVASREVTVLLTGAGGTGKTRIARLIHENSPRSARPFIEVNCANLQEALAESELFGALPGAHSTATRKIEGKVAAAEGGTLFLDEIGELQLVVQAKLLQLLQSKEYFPLGATRSSTADVRLIAATNVDLKAAVSKRAFREDLFYRLQVLPIRVPSLSERRQDVADLAAFFADRACSANKLPGAVLSPGAIRAVEASDWPGNVRELENAMAAAVIRADWDHSPQIERRHVFPDAPASSPSGAWPTYQQSLRRCQERILREALEETDWNVAGAARLLDVTRAHVYNLIRAFGLQKTK
jgi:Nif-specific regulatory protein